MKALVIKTLVVVVALLATGLIDWGTPHAFPLGTNNPSVYLGAEALVTGAVLWGAIVGFVIGLLYDHA